MDLIQICPTGWRAGAAEQADCRAVSVKAVCRPQVASVAVNRGNGNSGYGAERGNVVDAVVAGELAYGTTRSLAPGSSLVLW